MRLTRHRLRGFEPRGFSIIEVMISLVVLSVGLLGAAAMLLDSLRNNAGALQSLGATHLVRDMADRIRANLSGREHYDTRHGIAGSGACVEPEGCNAAQLAAADRARFAAAAGALFVHDDFTASVEYEPATGPAAPSRYVITLRWRGSLDALEDIRSVTLQVLAQSPVAG
jgi:type IV pilus assembly protein PilV